MTTAVFFALVIFQLTCGQTYEWSAIKILRTSRTEVEKRLGKPTTDSGNGEAAWYNSRDARIFVQYSVGTCPKSEWNVPSSTVVGVTVHPNERRSLTELGVDTSKYEKTADPEIIHLRIYTNDGEGVRIQVDEEDGVVETIRYYPRPKDSHLKCKQN